MEDRTPQLSPCDSVHARVSYLIDPRETITICSDYLSTTSVKSWISVQTSFTLTHAAYVTFQR